MKMEVWKPYEAALREIFRFAHPPDPDPSEWFANAEFHKFTAYLDAVASGRDAGDRADSARARRQEATDPVERDRAAEDQASAVDEMQAARKEQSRLDLGELGEIRDRAEKRLELRRQGIDLPLGLSFLKAQP